MSEKLTLLEVAENNLKVLELINTDIAPLHFVPIELDMMTKALADTRAAIAAHKLATEGPSWDDAPEWAMWLRMDDDGQWWWHEREPRLQESGGAWISPAMSRVSPARAFDETWKTAGGARPQKDEVTQ
mgnify:CR=1 FL=1